MSRVKHGYRELVALCSSRLVFVQSLKAMLGSTLNNLVFHPRFSRPCPVLSCIRNGTWRFATEGERNLELGMCALGGESG